MGEMTALRRDEARGVDAGADADERPASAVLEARGLSFAYARNRPVLDAVDARVAAGHFLAILGVNGCGKSTLLACLDALLHPQAGGVLLDGRALVELPRRERARAIALVEQRSHASRLTVYDAVLLGRQPHIEGAPAAGDFAAVERVLAELGLSELALRYVDELSGGEFQKVALARALAQETRVLLLDEPTSSLDPANQQEVMRAVRRAVDERGIAAAAVLHDVNLALRHCDRFLLMRDGRVQALGGSEVVTAGAMREIYGLEADIIEHGGHKVVIPR